MKKQKVYIGEGGIYDGMIFVGMANHYVEGECWYFFITPNQLFGTNLIEIGTL